MHTHNLGRTTHKPLWSVPWLHFWRLVGGRWYITWYWKSSHPSSSKKKSTSRSEPPIPLNIFTFQDSYNPITSLSVTIRNNHTHLLISRRILLQGPRSMQIRPLSLLDPQITNYKRVTSKSHNNTLYSGWQLISISLCGDKFKQIFRNHQTFSGKLSMTHRSKHLRWGIWPLQRIHH